MMDRSNEIRFEVIEDALFVANGGCPFSRKGVISICYSHLSEKRSDGVNDHFEDRDDKLIQAIRRTELKTYEGDRNRISADYNDEQETAQDYGGRLVWELLQNACDAMGKDNNSDVLIGSKGLGFKAVLEITDEPEIHSGDFHFLFSAKRTQKLLKKKKLHANPPSLTFRIPHECKPTEKTQELLNEGYVTVIRLPFRDEQAREMTRDLLHNLDAQFLLLIQELACVRIRTEAGETVHEMTRRSIGLSNDDRKLSTLGPNGDSQSSLWRRWMQCDSVLGDNEKQLTVAICLPLSKQGDAISHDKNIPFHVFFPTEETSGTRALIHASLDLEHNRKRVRKGDYDDVIRRMFRKLFQDVLKDIPARTALETFGNVVSEDGDSPLNNLQKDIGETLCQTRFVPVIGGGRVRPEDVQLWNDKLGLVLRDNAEEVREACLLDPELQNLRDVFRRFGAKDIEDEDYIRLLRYCRNESLEACLASWQVLIKGGLKRISDGCGDRLEHLRNVRCWWTDKESARALNSDRPLLFDHTKDWPDWLPADSLHPKMRTVLQCETNLKNDILQNWKKLVSERLLKERKEFLRHALLPFIAEWDFKHWQSNGWRVLRQVLSWWSSRTFDWVEPWIEEIDGNQEQKERRSLANNLRLPTDKGWLPAADCYAGEAWDGQPVFDQFFVSVENRGLVLPFDQWPDRIKKETKKDKWKDLLRWAGVSWEPKVRRVEDYPQHCLMEKYREDSDKPYEWLSDWQIEFFPECIYNTNNGVDSASIIRTMLPLIKAVMKPRATFYSSYYFKRKGEKDDNSEQINFAYYQLRHQKWLPCKPALFHPYSRVAPHDAFMPGKGLGLFPEVDRSGIDNEEWFGHITGVLRNLEVQDQLSEDPEKWHEWMKKLPELANHSNDETNDIQKVAESLYRKYLNLDLWNDDSPWNNPFKWSRYDVFPADIDVPCWCWEDNKEVLAFSSPAEVFYIDEPHFDEVRQGIEREGFKLFILRLNAGEDAPGRLGVRPLSHKLQAEPRYEEEVTEDSDRLSQRYRERRLGLNFAAKLKKALPEDLEITAVRDLRLELTSNGKSVTDVEVLSGKKEYGSLLINLDKGKWRALGHGLAARIARAEDKASLFENLLREDYWNVYLDRLRQEGVTEDDIKDAESAWTSGTVREEVADDQYMPEQDREEGLEQGREDGGTNGDLPPDQQPPEDPPGPRPSSDDPDLDYQQLPKRSEPSNGRPRPETGQAAEDWLEKELGQVFPKNFERQVRDTENRESDFVVSSDGREFHIEVKHVKNLPGTIYWTGHECDKAQNLQGTCNEYFMAILSDTGGGTYKILWIWDPLKELKRASRQVEWAGESSWKLKNTDSWDVETRRPDEVPTKRHKFLIKLNDEIIKGFEEDTEGLDVLCRKIDSLKAEKGMES